MASDDGGRPSRASMREVKREYKQRRKAEKARAEEAQVYRAKETRRDSTSRRWVAPVAGLTALAVVAGGTAFALKLGLFASSATASAASADRPAAAATSASPSATASASATAANDGTDPSVHAAFEDSPARSWPKGAAGFAVPKASSVGIYRAQQVADAYSKTRAYLREVLLDPHVLYQGALAPVYATMDAYSVTWIKGQRALWAKTHGKKGSPSSAVAVRFRPGDWRAAADTRVRGKVKASIGPSGVLRIDFTYVAAYWLVPRGDGEARTIAVRVEGEAQFYGNGPQRVTRLYGGLLGISSTAAVCNSKWKWPDFTEAWRDPQSAPVSGLPVADGSWDMSDPDATPPPGRCFQDTSGFR